MSALTYGNAQKGTAPNDLILCVFLQDKAAPQ
jgi:hypothetical protein